MGKSMLDLKNSGKQITSLNEGDLFLTMTDPDGTPDDGVVAWESIKAHIYNGGWIEVADTWQYASATSITVPAGATSRYKKGMGIRYKQGGGYKYAYIIGVSDTTLTVTGGDDYSVAADAITDVAYSPVPNTAIGFPSFFNYSPTMAGAITPGNGTLKGTFIIHGSVVRWWAGFSFGSTSSMGSGLVSFTHPFTVSVSSTGVDFGLGHAMVLDAGTTRFECYIEISNTISTILNRVVSGSQVTRGSFTSSTPMTWAEGDEVYMQAEAYYN